MVHDRAHRPKPEWFKIKPAGGAVSAKVRTVLKGLQLHTVCEGAQCPNAGECWGCGTAAIMILGDTCTRNCRFCAIKSGNPQGMIDPQEPLRVAEGIKALGLAYAVITSVDRDDLADGGADHFGRTVEAIKEMNPAVRVEVLTPDFGGEGSRLARVATCGADVLAHNVETVARLTPLVRDARCSYDLSLKVLKEYRQLAPEGCRTKSSIMLGLGELESEVASLLEDLLQVGVSTLTLGQYLQPTRKNVPVSRYVEPDEFERWRVRALEMGFGAVASGPLVRSSYMADKLNQGSGGE